MLDPTMLRKIQANRDIPEDAGREIRPYKITRSVLFALQKNEEGVVFLLGVASLDHDLRDFFDALFQDLQEESKAYLKLVSDMERFWKSFVAESGSNS